jgi:hypothetical protein
MAQEHPTAKKPTEPVDESKVTTGLKEAPPEAEVSGHMSYGGWYRCFHCGAANSVPAGWNFFRCWNCGATNLV